MSEWIEVAALAELRGRRPAVVTAGGQRIALFLVEGVADRVYAMRDTCVHKQRSLARGTVLHGRVVCPGHQWAFDLDSGKADDRDECQPTYPVLVEDGRVYVDPRPRALALSGEEGEQP